MAETRRVFITGGTRGLGYALAREFSEAGCAVFITGRTAETALSAAAALGAATGGRVHSGAGDAGSWEDASRLVREAGAAMGGIDIFVSNAGVGQALGMVWELEPSDMEQVVRTDLLGPMLAAKAAYAAMGEKGGWLWFVEGHGSDGRIMAGLSAYGSAKRALGYLWRALAVEAAAAGGAAAGGAAAGGAAAGGAAAGPPLKIGAISPGIMITEFTMDPLKAQDPERRRRTMAVFNALGDHPGTVAAYLAPRMLSAQKNGTRIAWLTGAKIMWRFATAGMTKRRVVEE